jgi:ketosteroid isomerase-like protein
MFLVRWGVRISANYNLGMRRFTFPLLLCSFGLVTPALAAQGLPAPGAPLTPQHPALTPLSQPTLTPGQIELMKLEVQFADDVAKGGGKAFASWFADDAVTLNNGKPATLGQRAIAANAQWDPRDYQLTWSPEGAQMGPSGDTGFTWGHYDATSKDTHGQPVTLGGRYITFWKKVNGVWKVALDASANDAPAAGDCCKVNLP